MAPKETVVSQALWGSPGTWGLRGLREPTEAQVLLGWTELKVWQGHGDLMEGQAHQGASGPLELRGPPESPAVEDEMEPRGVKVLKD